MSSDEPMFDDDVHVNLQNCRFIPRHLGHNQLPFVYTSPRGPLFWPSSSPECWVMPYVENWINHHLTWQFFLFTVYMYTYLQILSLSLSLPVFFSLSPSFPISFRSFFLYPTLLPLFPLFESFRSFTPIGGYRINN